MVSKILEHLYLGDMVDALKWEGVIICVMQEIPNAEPNKAYCIPIIRSKKELNTTELIADQDENIVGLKHQLDLVSTLIHKNRAEGKDVLVHCMAGIERSPLAIAYYLKNFHFPHLSWNESYEFIKQRRSEVSDRTQWLNLSYEERME